ncbi:hypothetical protein MPH_09139 [Macrophomina phaseolina MS6]|uniref:Uncharacterized protein n=1 Tax=Macrophomina phaseolina (strain MS6) TaxID=1126212 RepID=K2RGE1_MACPH|nr:hypothetical protein MPH_09139 [Macrophomina phaseolina MS6]
MGVSDIHAYLYLLSFPLPPLGNLPDRSRSRTLDTSMILHKPETLAQAQCDNKCSSQNSYRRLGLLILPFVLFYMTVYTIYSTPQAPAHQSKQEGISLNRHHRRRRESCDQNNAEDALLERERKEDNQASLS